MNIKLNWPRLIVAISIPFAAGVLGSLATAPAISGWYTELNKPLFTPPNWLFSPVWTLLFFLMGVSLYLVWQEKTDQEKSAALSIFALQIILNTLWSFLFFYFRNPLWAFWEIIILWLLILINIFLFYRLNKLAGLLLLPYLLWVGLAVILNYYIWILN